MLKKIVLPRTVAAFADHLFKNCRSLERVVISPRVTSMGGEAFANSGLVEVDLENVSTFGVGCFEGCAALQTVVPPQNATAFPDRLFKNCSALQRVGILPCV
jgi:hypothetical protein